MFKDKLKGLIYPEDENGNKNNKKRIENLVFFVVILIVTVVIINIIWNGDKNSSNNDKGIQNDTSKQLASRNTSSLEVSSNTSNELEIKLEEILAKIQGVGEVNVFINYSESSEVIPMYNENTQTSNTEETDTSGGTRTIEETDSQKEIIYEEKDGQKTIITQKIVEPQIEGAIITAKGAGNAEVKTSIIQAVEAVTGLPTHKIQVFEMD